MKICLEPREVATTFMHSCHTQECACFNTSLCYPQYETITIT